MTFADYLTVEWAPTNTPFEGAPTWVDVTTKVRSMRARSGSAGVEDVFGSGECVLDVNNESPGVAAWLDKNTWYRLRQLRVTCGAALLFHGWVDRVEHDVNFPFSSQARITCIDVIGLLSRAGGDGDFEAWWGTAPEDDATYGRIIDGQRGYADDGALSDLLTWIGDSSNGPYYSAGVNLPRIPMFIEADKNGGGLSVAQPYLEAQRATLVRDTGNPLNITEHNRYHSFGLAAGAATVTLTDAGGNYKYLLGSLRLSAPDEAYYDLAVVGGKGIAPQRAADVPTDYPATSYTRAQDSPLTDQNWAAANAAMIVAIGKQTNTYPRQLSCFVAGPAASSVDAGHPAVLCVRPGADRVDVVYDATTYKCQVISIDHEISIDDGWKVTFGFSSLDRLDNAYTSTSIITLGTSALSGTDILGP